MFAHAMADEIVALRSERDRYAAALDEIEALRVGPGRTAELLLRAARVKARKAREGTGQ